MFPKRKMSPVLKWAGGKTQLLKEILSNAPEGYNRYFEPFVGSGAVLLALQPQSVLINDTNEQLINLYRQLKDNLSAIKATINTLDGMPCDKEFYYSVRERYNRKIEVHSLDAECAALMVWINKHCFNGLYRVNSKGLFNVPYNNRSTGKSIDEFNLDNISEYLQSSDVEICCKDFEQACSDVSSGDFVYFDSPYIPESETANFTSYTGGGFTSRDHERLAALFRELDGRGAKVMLSNNDVPLVYDLYDGYNIRSMDVKRMINCDASRRKGKEVLVTNY